MLYPNIRAEMGRNGLTIKTLANNLSQSPEGVRRKLNGSKKLTLADVADIAALFDCSIDYLVGHAVKPPPSNFPSA